MVRTMMGAKPWQALRLRLGERSYGQDDLDELRREVGDTAVGRALDDFLTRWFDSNDTLTLQTSGSTGEPKRIEASKCAMLESAKMSCNFFDLGQEDVALLCMDLRYIGAMMLVVRAMLCGMRIILRNPSADVLCDPTLRDEGLSFASLVPLQVHHALEHRAELLQSIKQIIIGGAALAPTDREQLAEYPNAIYASYGMTETLSHIALARLSGTPSPLIFRPLEGIGLSVTNTGQLVVDAPALGVQALRTNDLVELTDDGGFCLIGRADWVINSGGVKISIDHLEERLGRFVTCPLAVTRCPDTRLGEAVVLVLECADNDAKRTRISAQLEAACAQLPRYHKPRHIIWTGRLPRLDSGKVDRRQLELQCRSGSTPIDGQI